MEKHQYGFAILNGCTGGTRRISFWGSGSTEDECKKAALSQAKAYAEKLTDQAYDKACRRERSNYRPSRSSYKFEVVGCSLWQ